MRKYISIRKITKDECPWLTKSIEKNAILYEYDGYTYGCITPLGIAITRKFNEFPFLEVPKSAIEEI